MDAILVERALQMAVTQTQQRPVLYHTDQGSQYTSADYQALVRQHSITMSMSDAWANALIMRPWKAYGQP